jgi:hypothetical protein
MLDRSRRGLRMSVELRITADGRNLECDWGVIEHGNPKPCHGEVGHLMLITPDYVKQLLTRPKWTCLCSFKTATTDGDRIFAHLDCEGQRWTWELFQAHWFDDNWFGNNGGPPILVGRWPD